MSLGQSRVPADQRRRLLPSRIPRIRRQEHDLSAEIIFDRRGSPELVHCLVQRRGSPEILFLGQFRSRRQARAAADDFIAFHLSHRTTSADLRHQNWNKQAAKGEIMMQLRIESDSGSPINEYRIHKGKLEFRALKPSGEHFPGPVGEWRVLDDSDIQLHHALGTVVSSWLKERTNHN